MIVATEKVVMIERIPPDAVTGTLEDMVAHTASEAQDIPSGSVFYGGACRS